VQQEESWPALLKKRLADRRGVPLDQVNLQNFAQVGASNAYIARTIIRQCDRVRPDLAVIAFTHRERTEYLAPGVTRSLGLWDLNSSGRPGTTAAMRYFNLYNTQSASLDLLKHMLLVQCAMVSRGIPYLLLWMNRTAIDDLEPLRHLKDMIDPGRLGSRCLLEPEILIDRSPVGHPGARSHANLASRIDDDIDFSEPKAAGIPSVRSCARRILVLGGPSPANIGGVPGCIGNPCACRELNRLHRFLDDATGPPLAESASNDRIVRTLLAECRRHRPDFVFARFSTNRSGEHFLENTLVELDHAAQDSSMPALRSLAEAYRQYTTDELHELNALRNILLAQEFLQSHRIPHIISIPPSLGPQEMGASTKHPVLRKHASLMRSTSLCNRRHRDEAPPQLPRSDTATFSWKFVKRLKERLRKSRTDDPNIYPLW
jgi:hypothetical protein